MRVLITGGTGTLGNELVKQLQRSEERVVVFSRDEFKQHEMRKVFPEGGAAGLRYFVGDVRDYDRLCLALHNVDIVIHAAALKHISTAEYNPTEAIKTNILGSMNVVNACNAMGVKKCVLASTDKAVSPANLYGATKLCAEKMFISGNNLGKCKFSVVRYGNVIGSRGSVIPIWKKLIADGKEINLTDERMTRFWIKIEDAAQLILNALQWMQGGEIFIPDIKAKRMVDIAREIDPTAKINVVGAQPGEKLHECLMSGQEAGYARLDREKGVYVIFPAFHDWCRDMVKIGIPMPAGFQLESSEVEDVAVL